MAINSDPATLAFYAAEAPTYVTARPEAAWHQLADFLGRLPKGASILELGSGGGIDAAYMIAAGFAVDPTDGVAEMAAQAEARLGTAVRVMRFEEIDVVERYDAVVASASLLHVPRAGLPDILGRVWRALVPGGWHLASYKTGGDEGYDEFGRYYNRPSVKQAETAYRAAGEWARVEIAESFEQGHFSKPSAWLTVIAQKV
jgi:SAM-dependent methyltransferase